jgi:GGDEF domain-containing protein
MIALHLPAAMIVLFSRGERPLFSVRAAARAASALLPLLLMLIVWKLEPGWLRPIIRWSVIEEAIRGWRLPDAALVLAVVFAVSIPLTGDRRMRAFVGALAASLVPIGYGLNALIGARRAAASAAAAQLSLSLGFCAAASILLYILYRIYWERVYLDDLTQILNRRALDEKLSVSKKRYSITMVDIDHFKKFNDTYGHDQGDHVLRLVAHHLRRAFGDRAFRYGGEEFCLLLDERDPSALKTRLDEARETLAETKFYLRAPRPKRDRKGRKNRGKGGSPEKRVHVTASFGVALSEEGESPKDVVKAADEALYAAKRRGRNRVVVAEPRRSV